MLRVSLNSPDLKLDPDDPPGFRSAMWRFGESLGARRVGTTLYEIPPGEAVCPYHYEHSEEEWLLVLDGTPTLREPDGEHRLEPMDVAFFPPGPAGAHQVRNDTAATARVLMWGENLYPGRRPIPTATRSLSGLTPGSTAGSTASGQSSTSTTTRATRGEAAFGRGAVLARRQRRSVPLSAAPRLALPSERRVPSRMEGASGGDDAVREVSGIGRRTQKGFA
jgi:quercetin dioxygenase-like cupin family protein